MSGHVHWHKKWLPACGNQRHLFEACISGKAKLDLIYLARRNLCLDMSIMLKTVFKRLR